MKHKLSTLILLSFVCMKVWAQDSTLFPRGEVGKNTNNYTGTIWLNELNEPDTNFTFGLAQAVYAPGAKLDWHVHPGGQYLLITEGEGYYQEKGSPAKVVHKGDIIRCDPNIQHWHGAVPNSRFAYVGVTPVTKGRTVWMNRVTDQEYANAQSTKEGRSTVSNVNNEQQIKDLSNKKWKWMADKNVDSLSHLFHEKSMFIHMGGSWGKTQELNVIKTGNIWYKKADVYSVTVNVIGNTAILLNDIDLVAVVGGKEVVNPFMVTEVYVRENNEWKMGSLTFSRLMRAVKNTESNNSSGK